MRWNLRMKAAERGIWKSTELRRLLADAGLEISAGKMSGWWTGTPNTIRLDELDIICAVLGCTPSEVLIAEPETVQLQRPQSKAVNDTDRRLLALRLTPSGRELVIRVLPVARQFQEDMLRQLGDAAEGLDTALSVLLDGGK